MTDLIRSLDNDINDHNTYNYIEDLLEVEQDFIDSTNTEELKSQTIEKIIPSNTEHNFYVITIGSMKFAIFSNQVDFIKSIDERLKVFSEQTDNLLGKILIADKKIDVIRSNLLHPNIVENSDSKQEQLLVFNESRHALLCDEISYHENLADGELVLFNDDLILTWFVGVHKEKAIRIIHLARLVKLLGLE